MSVYHSNMSSESIIRVGGIDSVNSVYHSKLRYEWVSVEKVEKNQKNMCVPFKSDDCIEYVVRDEFFLCVNTGEGRVKMSPK